MIEWLEKLINEHGSAVILKERITALQDDLAREKAATANERSAKQSAELDLAEEKRKSTDLELQVESLKEELEKLKLKPLRKPDIQSELSQEARSVLAVVVEHPTVQDFHVAAALGYSVPRATFLLGELKRRKLVQDSWTAGGYGSEPICEWTVTHGGLQALASLGLLK